MEDFDRGNDAVEVLQCRLTAAEDDTHNLLATLDKMGLSNATYRHGANVTISDQCLDYFHNIPVDISIVCSRRFVMI